MASVLTTKEAVQRFGRARVRHSLESKRWQRPTRGVVICHNGPVTQAERELVALAASPCGTVLAGLSALAHDGLTGFTPDSIYLSLPPGARSPRMPGLTIHWSTMLDERDVHPERAPRRTRPARSLADAASWAAHDRFARVIVIAGLQQGLVNIRQMRDALSRRGPCRRRSIIVESIVDSAGGIQSLPERDFSVLCAEIGLPAPSRQSRVKGASGRYYLDARWEKLGMSVEIHGIPHHAIGKWDADLRRANDIVIAGDRLLTFSSYSIRHEKDMVADQLIRMARSCGWTND